MSGRIKIDSERCKGCGLCVKVCPKGSIAISDKSNEKGYFPAEFVGPACTGCAMCAIICPDAVIEVYSENETNIVELPPGKRDAKKDSDRDVEDQKGITRKKQ